MQMQQCKQGHFYDPKKHSSCPYCGVPGLDIDCSGARSRQDIGVTEPRQNPAGDFTVNRRAQAVHNGRDEGKTQGHFASQGIDPVVGWLVCIEGTERGRDYRIRSENNSLGRLENNDIQIRGDEAISRERHAVLTYDPDNNVFVLQPGGGRGMVYLNGQALYSACELSPFDKIKLGKTVLLFVPCCGEFFKW